MKLLRYGPVGQEKPGILDVDGNIRDLAAVVADIDAAAISPEGLARLAAIDPAALPMVAGSVRLGVPVAGVRKFIAVGLNYVDHAAESNMAVPTEPVLFTKAISCLCGANDDVIKPRDSTKLDWEVELGIVIGKRASYVSEADAPDYVAGYTLINDVSERAFQLELGGTWDKGKGCDTFGPTGPWLVTKDSVADVHELDMWLDVNGERMQTGNTRTLIFNVPQMVSYISRFITLEPGDLITTGTPPGVGMGKKPTPIFLNVGDVMELGIQGLGQQRQTVVAWQAKGAQS